MDRPPVNAQNTPFREELTAAFDSFSDRDDVRVVILTGIWQNVLGRCRHEGSAEG